MSQSHPKVEAAACAEGARECVPVVDGSPLGVFAKFGRVERLVDAVSRWPQGLRSAAAFADGVAEAAVGDATRDGRAFLDSLGESRAWNFGVVVVDVDAWRSSGLTEKYVGWLEANARHEFWPSDSLAFGLGLPFLALRGSVECFEDVGDVRFEQGLGVAPLAASGRSVDDLAEAFALHWNGNRKPWDRRLCDAATRPPFLAALARSPSVLAAHVAGDDEFCVVDDDDDGAPGGRGPSRRGRHLYGAASVAGTRWASYAEAYLWAETHYKIGAKATSVDECYDVCASLFEGGNGTLACPTTALEVELLRDIAWEPSGYGWLGLYRERNETGAFDRCSSRGRETVSVDEGLWASGAPNDGGTCPIEEMCVVLGANEWATTTERWNDGSKETWRTGEIIRDEAIDDKSCGTGRLHLPPDGQYGDDHLEFTHRSSPCLCENSPRAEGYDYAVVDALAANSPGHPNGSTAMACDDMILTKTWEDFHKKKTAAEAFLWMCVSSRSGSETRARARSSRAVGSRSCFFRSPQPRSPSPKSAAVRPPLLSPVTRAPPAQVVPTWQYVLGKCLGVPSWMPDTMWVKIRLKIDSLLGDCFWFACGVVCGVVAVFFSYVSLLGAFQNCYGLTGNVALSWVYSLSSLLAAHGFYYRFRRYHTRKGFLAKDNGDGTYTVDGATDGEIVSETLWVDGGCWNGEEQMRKRRMFEKGLALDEQQNGSKNMRRKSSFSVQKFIRNLSFGDFDDDDNDYDENGDRDTRKVADIYGFDVFALLGKSVVEVYEEVQKERRGEKETELGKTQNPIYRPNPVATVVSNPVATVVSTPPPNPVATVVSTSPPNPAAPAGGFPPSGALPGVAVAAPPPTSSDADALVDAWKGAIGRTEKERAVARVCAGRRLAAVDVARVFGKISSFEQKDMAEALGAARALDFDACAAIVDATSQYSRSDMLICLFKAATLSKSDGARLIDRAGFTMSYEKARCERELERLT